MNKPIACVQKRFENHGGCKVFSSKPFTNGSTPPLQHLLIHGGSSGIVVTEDHCAADQSRGIAVSFYKRNASEKNLAYLIKRVLNSLVQRPFNHRDRPGGVGFN